MCPARVTEPSIRRRPKQAGFTFSRVVAMPVIPSERRRGRGLSTRLASPDRGSGFGACLTPRSADTEQSGAWGEKRRRGATRSGDIPSSPREPRINGRSSERACCCGDQLSYSLYQHLWNIPQPKREGGGVLLRLYYVREHPSWMLRWEA
ncbi:hypothetical protein MHYP_G00106880 [Metynnis hypsauchen]